MPLMMKSTGEHKHAHWDPKLHRALVHAMFNQIRDSDDVYCGVSLFTWRGLSRWAAINAWLDDHGYLKDFPDLDEATKHTSRSLFFNHCANSARNQITDYNKTLVTAPLRTQLDRDLTDEGADPISSQEAADIGGAYIDSLPTGSHVSISLCGEATHPDWRHFDSSRPSRIGMSVNDFTRSTVESTQNGIAAVERSVGDGKLVIFAEAKEIVSGTDILSASRVEDKTLQKATGKRKRTNSPTKVLCQQQIGVHVGNQTLQSAVQNSITTNTINTKAVVGIHIEPDWIGTLYTPDPMVSPYVMECMNCEDRCVYENSRWNVCGKDSCQSVVRKHLQFGFPWDH